MLTRPMLGMLLFLILVSLTTAGYLSRQRGSYQYYGGAVGSPNVGELVTVQLFNPSAEVSVDFNLDLPNGQVTGQLAPLSSRAYDAPGMDDLKLSSTGEILAWRVTRKLDKGQELSRDTQPFFNLRDANRRMLFPWIQANTGVLYESGWITVYNTEEFSADINYYLYNEETGSQVEQRSFIIPPTAATQFPAATLHVGPEAPRFGVVMANNAAALLGSYTGPTAQGSYGYWSSPTYAFSSVSAPRTAGISGPAQDKQVGSTLPFSNDHVIYQDDAVSSWYRIMKQQYTTTFEGEAQVDIVQTGDAFTLPLTHSPPAAPLSFPGSDLVPGTGHYSGTVGMETYDHSATSLSVYSTKGDRAATPAAAEFRGRAVFPIDGREPWNDQLSASSFVFNNKSSADLPLAIALLDEDGHLLDVRYPILAPGASEVPVHDFLTGFPAARSFLVETGNNRALLTLHLIVSGSGEGFGQMIDYIAPAHAAGCASIGLGPENYFNWAQAYRLGCDRGTPSVLGLVQQTNQGHPPPYHD